MQRGILLEKRQKLFTLIMISFVIIVILFITEIFFQYYAYKIRTSAHIDESLYKYHQTYGWILNDGEHRHIHRDFDVTYKVVNQNRFTENGDKTESLPIVNFYGDSYCFGMGVKGDQTVPSQASMLLSEYYVKNNGVSGYGPLQYFLRYKDSSAPENINVFMIFIGNDYRDILRDSIEWGPKKPVLVKRGDKYEIIYPEKNEFKDKSNTTAAFRIQTLYYGKHLIKSIPFVVKLRNKFVEADKKTVDAAMESFNYIYGDMNNKNNIFVLIPSISYINKISVNTDEGYFRDSILKYFEANHFSYIDMSSEGLLNEDDFWAHEGHNNAAGNKKIAQIVSDYIRANY